MASEQERTRERVAQFFASNAQLGKAHTVAHFVEEGLARSTVYRILNRSDTIRKSGSGRKPQIMTKKQVVKLKRMFKNRGDNSCRTAARKLGCSFSYVAKKVRALGLKHYKRRKCPDYTEQQKAGVKKQATWLYRTYHKRRWVLDDEKYFTFGGSQRTGYYAETRDGAPDSVKFKPNRKFEPKVMLYTAISDAGLSRPIVKVGGNSVDAEYYKKHCLRKSLYPFLRKCHGDGNYVFWPDKARSHYARLALEDMSRYGVRVVTWERNPTNLPQCRPIEDFFGYLSQIVYRGGWRAGSPEQLINRIKAALRKVDPNVVRRLGRCVKKRLRIVSRQGPLALVH